VHQYVEVECGVIQVCGGGGDSGGNHNSAFNSREAKRPFYFSALKRTVISAKKCNRSKLPPKSAVCVGSKWGEEASDVYDFV